RQSFAPFQAWGPVLRTPGVTFVNLQYGDCGDELGMARRDFGAHIVTPPGIDLRADLDDLTALAGAVDLVIGVSNATFNLAAAAGVPCWLIAAPDAWTTLGTERYPWYPQARLYSCKRFGEWDAVMAAIARDLGARPSA
ncbi:MAG: flagellar protein FlbA, partial [Phenylobacterium sp.]